MLENNMIVEYDADDEDALQITEQMHAIMVAFSEIGVDRVHVGGLLRIMGLTSEEAEAYDNTWASLHLAEDDDRTVINKVIMPTNLH